MPGYPKRCRNRLWPTPTGKCPIASGLQIPYSLTLGQYKGPRSCPLRARAIPRCGVRVHLQGCIGGPPKKRSLRSSKSVPSIFPKKMGERAMDGSRLQMPAAGTRTWPRSPGRLRGRGGRGRRPALRCGNQSRRPPCPACATAAAPPGAFGFLQPSCPISLSPRPRAGSASAAPSARPASPPGTLPAPAHLPGGESRRRPPPPAGPQQRRRRRRSLGAPAPAAAQPPGTRGRGRAAAAPARAHSPPGPAARARGGDARAPARLSQRHPFRLSVLPCARPLGRERGGHVVGGGRVRPGAEGVGRRGEERG